MSKKDCLTDSVSAWSATHAAQADSVLTFRRYYESPLPVAYTSDFAAIVWRTAGKTYLKFFSKGEPGRLLHPTIRPDTLFVLYRQRLANLSTHMYVDPSARRPGYAYCVTTRFPGTVASWGVHAPERQTLWPAAGLQELNGKILKGPKDPWNIWLDLLEEILKQELGK